MGKVALALSPPAGEGLASQTGTEAGEEAVLVLPLALGRLVLHSLLSSTSHEGVGVDTLEQAQRRGAGHAAGERGRGGTEHRAGRRAEEGGARGRGGGRRGGERPRGNEDWSEHGAGHCVMFWCVRGEKTEF